MKVYNHVGARRRAFLEAHTLQGSLSEKILNGENYPHSLGNTRIEARESERVKHNERVRVLVGMKRGERRLLTNRSRKR